MATRQSTVRLPERSWQQLGLLSRLFGDNTKALTIAVDRLYQDEMSVLRGLLPALTITGAQIVHHDDLTIETALATIKHGYSLAVTLQFDGQNITIETLNLLVTGDQTSDWCITQCERLAAKFTQNSYTPGEIMRLLHCGHQPLVDLGIPVPPSKRFSARTEQVEYHERTGNAMIYLENELHREWAIAYNAWIKANPELAADYGCVIQDEDWVPVK